MDLSAVVFPGAQSLVSAMLSDAWAGTRAVIARRWGRGSHRETAQAESRLEDGRTQALALAGDGPARDAILAAYWAGYLAALLAERPDLLDAVRDLGAPTQPAAAVSRSEVHNSNTGTVHGKLLQAGDIHGDISF
jgi:hypothetical protein